jgi:hypothetical protein
MSLLSLRSSEKFVTYLMNNLFGQRSRVHTHSSKRCYLEREPGGERSAYGKLHMLFDEEGVRRLPIKCRHEGRGEVYLESPKTKLQNKCRYSAMNRKYYNIFHDLISSSTSSRSNHPSI